MTADYCQCDQPVIDHDDACRRCGLPVNYATPVGWVVPMADGSFRYLHDPDA